MPNTVQSVERALDLLLAVADADGEAVGVRELARRTGLKAPTAHDLLRTLMVKGFLAFDEPVRGYRLGPAAARLSRDADTARAMAAFARPYIERLHKALGETLTVMISEGERVVTVSGIQPDNALAVVPSLGAVRHPHCLATGQVALAHWPEDARRRYAESEPLSELGPNAPQTPEALLKLLERVRKRGWGEAVDVRSSGIAAVAVPVLDGRGELAMGIGCSAPLSRFNATARRAARENMKDVAREMAEALA